jgi:quinol monooxygenase YgiN
MGGAEGQGEQERSKIEDGKVGERIISLSSRGANMIFVIASIEVKPGKREAFLAEFRKNMPNVHAEKGCIEYGPNVDLKTEIRAQVPLREDVVTIVEKWESLDALMAHLAAPHMAEYRTKVKEIVVGTSLQVLRPA